MSRHKYSSRTSLDHNESPCFVRQNGVQSPKTPTRSQPLIEDLDEAVPLHRLIIGSDTVICMPEVNKVLRNVYQVLSQANYYLSKHGISSRRFSGAQLIKIKMLGILNHDAKVCSYIRQQEAERIFDSFDLSGSCLKSQKISWMDPILLDENPQEASNGSKDKSQSESASSNVNPVDLQVFSLNNEHVVCAPDIQKVIQTHFNQGATTGYYFSKLGIVPFKFIHSGHLDKVKELGIIKKSAVHCTYVSKDDAKRVFEAYGMSAEDMQSKVNWLTPVNLDDLPGWSKHRAVKTENIQSPAKSNSPNTLQGGRDASHYDGADDREDAGTTPANIVPGKEIPSTVSVFLVEGNEVVCMPDIHRMVQSVHGSSIQVNYYLNKLHVKKKRFCFAHLKELKARGILQGNATYCTYIPKAEAEKIFQIYSLMGDQQINELQWSETLRLDQPGSESSYASDLRTNFAQSDFDDTKSGSSGTGLTVTTFLVDGEEVICTPDVHKIVDYLEEQSASLDYHFRKLGIVKHRYTYSQLHQLRRLQIIKRPTVCTYIRKTDVEQLLLMYATERNRNKMQRIQWLDPMPLLASDHGPQRPNGSPSLSPEINSGNTEDHAPNEAPGMDYEMSDLYKVYVGDRVNSDHETRVSSPSSRQHRPAHPLTTMADIQHSNPHIDCPIVIPNADFDPKTCSSPLNFSAFSSPHAASRSREHTELRDREGNHVTKKRKGQESDDPNDAKKSKDHEVIVERLLKDLHRKETELRFLHDAYQREINIEREKRIDAERDLEKVKDDLIVERQMRERLEDELRHFQDRSLEHGSHR